MAASTTISGRKSRNPKSHTRNTSPTQVSNYRQTDHEGDTLLLTSENGAYCKLTAAQWHPDVTDLM